MENVNILDTPLINPRVGGATKTYPLESTMVNASALPLQDAQCTAVHPSSSSLFRSFLEAFFSTAALPSFAAWWIANRVGVSDIAISFWTELCYLTSAIEYRECNCKGPCIYYNFGRVFQTTMPRCYNLQSSHARRPI